MIREETGVHRSLTQIRHFVTKHLKMRRRKIQPIPEGKVSLQEQAKRQKDFIENTLNALIMKSLSGEEKLFFCDAIHPIHDFYNTYIYSEKPKYQRTSNGRYRFNLLSALDVTDIEVISVYGGTYVNSETVIQLLNSIRSFYPDEIINIVLDNARYQIAKIVQERAKELNIKLHYLPTYSPNLNLIERFWKFLKKKVLAGKYYETKEEFSKAFLDFLTDVNDGKYNFELDTLLTYKFQDLTKLAV